MIILVAFIAFTIGIGLGMSTTGNTIYGRYLEKKHLKELGKLVNEIYVIDKTNFEI